MKDSQKKRNVTILSKNYSTFFLKRPMKDSQKNGLVEELINIF
jgi:hypothetical protein